MKKPRHEHPSACPICLAEKPLTFHHFICKSVHRNKWFRARYSREELQRGIFLCRACHSTIHRLIPDRKEMSRHYNTPARLLEHPEFARFVSWARRRARKPGGVADDRDLEGIATADAKLFDQHQSPE